MQHLTSLAFEQENEWITFTFLYIHSIYYPIRFSPIDSFTYIYEIPDDHSGGTFWYHAHNHGSTAIQVGGGMIGVLIVEDAADEVPAAFHDMSEVVLLMSDTPVGNLMTTYTSTTGDALFASPDNLYTASSEFVLVNGQYQHEFRRGGV